MILTLTAHKYLRRGGSQAQKDFSLFSRRNKSTSPCGPATTAPNQWEKEKPVPETDRKEAEDGATFLLTVRAGFI